MNKKVIIVFKSHLDNGYTDLSENVLHNYCTGMLESMLDTCESTADLPMGERYIWTMSAWLLHHVLHAPETSPENKERLETCIARRQVVWMQMPFTLHTEFCGLEEIIRGFHFSDELSERYGYYPITAKMTDVPGHTSYLASILNRRGIGFIHLGCNPCCMPPDVPRLFWWQGPDGRRVLTMYSKGSYGSSMLPPENWNYPVWLYLAQTNDNTGCHTREQVQTILTKARREMPDTQVVIGTLDDFYEELCRWDLETLSVVNRDLADTRIHGVGSCPAEVAHLREARPILTGAEQISTLLYCQGLLTDEEKESCVRRTKEAFDQALLFDEHTWGMAGLTGLGRERPFEKKEFLKSLEDVSTAKARRSWEEQRERAEAMCRKTEKLETFTIQRLADAVLESERELVVYNALGWKRSGFVNLDGWDDWLKGYALYDVEIGETVTMGFTNGHCQAWIRDIPATGWKKLIRIPVQERKEANSSSPLNTLENKRFQIVVDSETGGIISFYDKFQKYQYARSDMPMAQYSYDLYGDKSERRYLREYVYRFTAWVVDDLCRINMPEQEEQVFLPRGFTLEKETCGGLQTLKWSSVITDESVTKYGNGRRISFALMISDAEDVIDLSVSLESKQATPFPEGATLSLPLALDTCRIEINKIGCVLDPMKDFEKDANHVLYCCENWVAVSGSNVGMLIVPLDTPLFGIGSRGIYEFQSSREKISPHLYFNLLNTQWGTNFPQWISGDFTWRFRLIPLTGSETMEEKQRLAWNAATPLLAARRQRMLFIQYPGRHIGQGSFLECEAMRILALFPDENSSRIHVRLIDISGKEKETTIFLSPYVGRVWELVPNMGKKELRKCHDRYVLGTKPYEIHDLLLDLV